IASGTSTVSLYYRDTQAGNPSVSVSNGTGLANPTPQVETVLAGSASQLVFTTPSRTFTAGVCAGAGNVITVQLRDAYGNAVNASGAGQALVATSSSTGTVTWFSDSACSTTAAGGNFTIGAGASTASLYYRDTQAG